MVAPNTIVLKQRGLRKEALAAGTIRPGMLVMRDSALKYVAHNLAGGKAALIFACENELNGQGIDDNYSSGDTTFVEYVQSGAEIYGLVAANAAAITKGDFLESDGAGGFRKARDLTAAAGTPVSTGIMADVSASPTQTTINNALATAAALVSYPGAIAVALETLDNSANASAARLQVEVL